jgi:hypothetical protein
VYNSAAKWPFAAGSQSGDIRRAKENKLTLKNEKLSILESL